MSRFQLSKDDQDRIRKAFASRRQDLVNGVQALAKATDLINIPLPIQETIQNIFVDRQSKSKRKPVKYKVKRQTSDWKMTQKRVAADLNQGKVYLEDKAPPMGGCTIQKVKDMDRRHPDADHANWFGYHAELRLKSCYSQEYIDCINRWKAHWAAYKRQFLAWRETHPASKRSSFRFKPDIEITGLRLENIGIDGNGDIIQPRRKNAIVRTPGIRV